MINTTHSITIRRSFSAPKPRVFSAFQSAEALAKWFTPSADVSVEILAFQFEPKGEYKLRYTMPDNTYSVVHGTYDQITPYDKISFSWMWEAPDPHADIPTRVCIQFLAKGDGTELVLAHERLPSKEACTRHAEAWERTLDRLENVLP